jgi:hypothetical protein
MAKRFLTPIGIVSLPLDPPSGSNGQIYFNSSTNELKLYYDGQWNSLSTGGGGGTETESGVQLSTSWWLGA